MKVALVLLALLGLVAVCHGQNVLRECAAVSSCIDYIVSLGSSCSAAAFTALHNETAYATYMDVNFDSGTLRSTLRQGCLVGTASSTLNANWFNGFSDYRNSVSSGCPFPRCPYGFVPNPANSTFECFPAAGFPQTSKIPAYQSLQDCLKDRTPLGFVSGAVSFRTRTCMSEFNKSWKNCMAKSGLLG